MSKIEDAMKARSMWSTNNYFNPYPFPDYFSDYLLDEKFKDVKSKITIPQEATNEFLSIVHTDEYLESLKVC